MERVQKWCQTFRGHSSSANPLARWLASIVDDSDSRASKEETLDEKLTLLRKALKGTFRHSSKLTYLLALSAGYWLRYADTSQPEDLEQCIRYAQQLLDISNGVELRIARSRLADALLRRYDRFGQMADLNKSIQYGEQVLREAPMESLGSCHFLYIHSHALRTRYIHQYQSRDLDHAVIYAHQVLNAEPEDSPDRALYLGNLSRCLLYRSEKRGYDSDLESSVQLAQQAVDIIPMDDQRRSAHLAALGWTLGCRFDRSGSTTDLERSLELQVEAVDDASKRGRVGSDLLHGLAVAFMRRYNMLRAEDDLEQYIRYAQQAVDIASPSDPNLHEYVKHLGTGYMKRYESNGRLADLEKTIEIKQHALHVLPADHPARPQFLASLCVSFQRRAQKLDQPKDISQAICYAKEAVASVPEEHAQRSYLLFTLAGAYLASFYILSESTDLDHSIEYMQAALSCFKDGYLSKGEIYLFLGEGFSCRSGIFFQQSDLEQATGYLQEALKWFPAHHTRRAYALAALGNAYANRYTLSLNAEKTFLDVAIEQHRLALSCTPDTDRLWPKFSIELSRLLLRRSRQEDDIDSASAHCRNALHATALNDNRMRIECFVCFGEIFDRKFTHFGRVADLQQSIQWHRQALELMESNSRSRGSVLMALGVGYFQLQEHSKSAQDLEVSDEFMEQAFHVSRLARERLLSGSNIVILAVDRGSWSRAAKYLDMIAPLLTDMFPLSRSRDESQLILRRLCDIANVSATVYLNVGRSPLEALELLERFRGIIANLLIDAKSDISILKDQHPQLWNEYSRCRDEVSQSSLAVTAPSHAVSDVQDLARNKAVSSRRQQLFQKLQHLQAEIRNCAGFEKFLHPPQGEDIAALAKEGPLVCLNINDHGSHAFLVTSSGVEAIPLPRYTEDRMRYSVAVLNSRVYPQHRDAEIVESDAEHDDDPGVPTSDKTAKELQHWWFFVVKPVLKKLGLLRETGGAKELPRIWWVGGGIMSLIPLHAAGEYADNPMENATSHVVSSYVPTLKVLQSLRRRSPISISSEARKLMIVSMPVTPGTYNTLNTEQEVDAILKYSKSVANVTTLTRPTKDTVIEALKSSVFAHFACHGSVNLTETGKSALIVGRDTIQQLTVDEVLNTIMHSGAEIAYLSACSTAEIEPGNLIHESIHLVSAFQLAGFKSVIGTLWRAHDSTAVAIAGKFYELLFREKNITGKSVAYALHEAVVQYQRAAGTNASSQITKWAPFIHFGC